MVVIIDDEAYDDDEIYEENGDEEGEGEDSGDGGGEERSEQWLEIGFPPKGRPLYNYGK
jgi:hypothetical protein